MSDAATHELSLSQGSEDWKRLRKLATETVVGKKSALYNLNAVILGKAEVVPMTYRAHLGMTLFAESATGVPEVDACRIKLILVPRGVGKSSLITKGLPILRTLRNPEYATGIANETAALAATFLGDIKHEFESNVLLRTLFPEVIPDDFKATTWKADRIITKRVKANPTSPTVLAIGVGGTATGVHMNEWISDDLLSQNAAEAAYRGNNAEIEATNRWITRLQPLLRNPKRDPLLFIGCIAKDEPVLMANGTWKAIQDIQVGDEVWATKKNGSEGFAARRVTGVWPQGEADVVEIDVAGRQVRATPNHPFLVSEGRMDGVGRAWKEASQLQGKMEVFCSKGWHEYEHPHAQAWLVGFLLGDGWITKTTRTYQNAKGETRSNGTTYSVCFAKGVREDINAIAKHELQRLTEDSKIYDVGNGTMRLDSNSVGKMLEDLGLLPGVGAKEKSVPEWIFRESLSTRRTFLIGLGDADGHWTGGGRYTLEVTSEQLVRDVHLLAMMSGCRPSRITSRVRWVKAPNSSEPVRSESWHVAINLRDPVEETHRYKVKSVKPAGRAEVFDLTIEDGECAFIANGLISANTRWWEGDSYEFIESFWGRGEERRTFSWQLRLPPQKMKWEGGTIDRPAETQNIKLFVRGEVAIFHFPAIDENGRPIFPERYDLDELAQMQEEDPVFYAGQYLLEPTAGAASTFDPAWLKTYAWDGAHVYFVDKDGTKQHVPLASLSTYISVDPAFSKKSSSARTAIPVVGTDGKNLLLLEDFAERVDSEDDIAAKVVEFYRRYKAKKIFVETIVAQVAVANAIRRRFREEGLGEPPLEEIRSHGIKNKVMRVFGLEHYFKRGIFYYHPNQRKFFQEYVAFPRAILRDILDALSFQVNEWERLFSITHFHGGPVTPESVRDADASALARVKAAWGRRRRRG